MKIKIAVFTLLVLFLASCSTVTPSPDFSVIELSNNAYAVCSPTSFVEITKITVQNNTSVETMIYRSTYQYLKSGDIIYESPTDTFMSMNILIPANTTVNGITTRGTVYIENTSFPFPSKVWDKMVDNDWDGVTLRIFLHGKDNYGYNKTFTTSFDFGVITSVK